MRLVDEISERPPARPLPAPSGPRVPTRSVPITRAPSPTPPADSTMPVLPYLPPVAPKSAAPVTGQVAATLVAAALHFQDAAVAPATARPAKRRRKRLITLGIIIAVPLLLAVIFRNSAFVEGFTGKSYDSNPLPTDVVDEDPAEIRPVTVI